VIQFDVADEDELKTLVLGALESARNANALVDEATLLFQNGHWARALALSIAALEEDGKQSLLSRAACGFQDPSTEAMQKRSHDLKQHGVKQSEGLRSIEQIYGPLTLARIAGGLTEAEEVVEGTRDLRESALYVDVRTGVVKSPLSEITKERAASFLALATNLRAGRAWLYQSQFEVVVGYFKAYREVFIAHAPDDPAADGDEAEIQARADRMISDLSARFEWRERPPGTLYDLRFRPTGAN
jgi:AbiV family abortive infection protein